MSFLRVQELQVQLDEEEAATLEDVEVAVDEARASQDTDFFYLRRLCFCLHCF